MNDEIKKYLKENLRIVVEEDYSYDHPSKLITVKLLLENEVISVADGFYVGD